jgi:hypothetical protein
VNIIIDALEWISKPCGVFFVEQKGIEPSSIDCRSIVLAVVTTAPNMHFLTPSYSANRKVSGVEGTRTLSILRARQVLQPIKLRPRDALMKRW